MKNLAKKKIMKNEMYVISQPKRAVVSIVSFNGVDPNIPLSKDLHEGLAELKSISDLVFIFPKGFSKKVKLKKFTTLYQGNAYIEVDNNEATTFIKTLDYCREIFACHVNFEIVYASNFPGEIIKSIPLFYTPSIVQLTLSNLEIERYSAQDLWELYKKGVSIFRKEENDISGIHRIFYSNTPIIRLTASTVDAIRKLPEKYYSTFYEYPRDLVPSAIKFLGLEYTNKNIQDL